MFEPLTRPELMQRRLLIIDGHSSHITANVIAHCIEHAINLLILLPHTLHVLRPLDVSVFSLLKRALAIEINTASRPDAGCVVIWLLTCYLGDTDRRCRSIMPITDDQ